MTKVKKAGDFAMGAVVIAAAPIVSIFILGALWQYLPFTLPDWAEVLALLVIMVIPLVACLGACSWRRKHRRLAMNVFPWEVLVGATVGLVFVAYYILVY